MCVCVCMCFVVMYTRVVCSCILYVIKGQSKWKQMRDSARRPTVLIWRYYDVCVWGWSHLIGTRGCYEAAAAWGSEEQDVTIRRKQIISIRRRTHTRNNVCKRRPPTARNLGPWLFSIAICFYIFSFELCEV